ncbi:MAG: MFS transporter [Chloroflexi bacterium]|nr:MFS transporter [Chloroflexota bacterium]
MEDHVKRTRAGPATWLPRVFYGWWIVAAAFVIHGLSGALFFHAFGAYFVYLQAEFGWSRTLISGAFSLSRLESGFLGPLQGWLINRFGSRTVVRIGLLLFGVGFLLFTQVDSALTFYGAFLIIALGSGLCGFLTLNIVLMNWFEKRRSTAVALSAAGSSVAGLMVPAVALALGTFGWRTTAVGSAILLLIVGLPVSQAIRQTPEAHGHVPDGRGTPEPSDGTSGHGTGLSGPAAGFAAREALRTRSFWLLAAGHGLALMSVSAVSAHLIPFLVAQLNMTIESAAGMVAVLTGVSLVAHLVGGFIGDRVNRRLIATLCMAGHAAALAVLASAPTPAVVAIFAVLQGLSWGFRGPLMTPLRAEYFGRRALATLEGFAALVTTAGLTLGPIAVGVLADRMGDYRLAFLFVATMAGVGMLCFGLAARPTRLAGVGAAARGVL